MGAQQLLPLDWTGQYPPEFAGTVPEHIAIVMDGNGRWANERGLTRVEGHRRGERTLLDVVAGAVQAGIKHLTVYAFSTENWRRSPEEVRFLMGFNRQVLRSRRDQLHAWNVRMRWAGRSPKLWSSVLKELQIAQQHTRGNTGMTLTMCINYGGRNEIVDATRKIAAEVAASIYGRRSPHTLQGSADLVARLINRVILWADPPASVAK